MFSIYMLCDEVTRWGLQAPIWTHCLIITSNTLLLWTCKLNELYVFVLLIVLLKHTKDLVLSAHTSVPMSMNTNTKLKTLQRQTLHMMKRPLGGKALWYEDWMTACEHGLFVHAWNQGSAPDALTTCIPAAEACIVHTSYQPAQFKYFAVLLNFSSTFSPDPFQMCEPQAKWGGSKLRTYVLITHKLCVSAQYCTCLH